MKLRMKRAMLIIKKYLFVALFGMAGYFLTYGISEAVEWHSTKRLCKEQKEAGDFLTINLSTRELETGKVEVFNKKLNKVVGSYDQVYTPNYGPSMCDYALYGMRDPLLVCDNNRYGFIDHVSGEVLVKPQFVLAWEVDSASGLAACVNEDLKLGFVNIKAGQVAIPFQFDIDSAYLSPDMYKDYTFFDFVFRNGYALVPGSGGKVGIINEAGDIVLPIEYNDLENKDYGSLGHPWIDVWHNTTLCGVLEPNYYNDYDFEQPAIIMKQDSNGDARYGMFDMMGVMNIPVEYDQIAFVESSNKVMALCQNNGILRGVDNEGNLMNDFCFYNSCTYEDCATMLLDPEEKTSPYIQYKALNGYAVMDTDFRVVIEPNDYWDIQYLGHGIFACGNCDDYSVILKDEKFKSN